MNNFPNELISIILLHINAEKIMGMTDNLFVRRFIKNNRKYRDFLIEPFKKEFLDNILRKPYEQDHSRLLLFTNELLNISRGKIRLSECSYITKYYLLFDDMYLSLVKTFPNNTPWYSNIFFW
jgi:hypothetical protein